MIALYSGPVTPDVATVAFRIGHTPSPASPGPVAERVRADSLGDATTADRPTMGSDDG
ncbi:hypothetical protein Aph02nite_45320 [Actinoplanes philippinensis]|nr:hypothetical protein Aph02nite_45320 [Actinoplanes philippinensis]